LSTTRKQVIGQGRVLSKATILGDLVFISGIGPHDPKTGRQVEGGIREQTRTVMELMKAALEEAGSSLDDVLKCTVFLTDMSHYAEMNEVYGSYFKVAPARTCVEVSKLPRPDETCMIEIDAIACKNPWQPRPLPARPPAISLGQGFPKGRLAYASAAEGEGLISAA